MWVCFSFFNTINEQCEWGACMCTGWSTRYFDFFPQSPFHCRILILANLIICTDNVSFDSKTGIIIEDILSPADTPLKKDLPFSSFKEEPQDMTSFSRCRDPPLLSPLHSSQASSPYVSQQDFLLLQLHWRLPAPNCLTLLFAGHKDND